MRVAVSLMAFSGLRPEVLGNYEGTDGLKLSDLEDLNVETMKFEKIPCKVNVRFSLSKARFQYFTFIGKEGCEYIKAYFDKRSKNGEVLTPESPVIQMHTSNTNRKHKLLRTLLISRDIREAMRNVGIEMRPYILRAYFATSLDIAESKGLISHPWRQFIMGHKGDIESVYSTNKHPLPETLEAMRSAYLKSSRYFETTELETREEEYIRELRETALGMVETLSGITLAEKEKEDLYVLPTKEFQQRLKDISNNKRAQSENNGNKFKTIQEKELDQYLNSGWELVQIYPTGNKAVVKLP